jgi:uncharacterized protein
VNPPLLIVGASARSAAQSAVRAGFAPLAIDLFADVDLREIALTRRCERYPDDIPRLAATLPAAPFLYTGALENAPRVLQQLQRDRPLWGNGEASLRRVRDPLWVRRVLHEAGFPTLPARLTLPPRNSKNRWLRKPIASAAGLGIAWASHAPSQSGRGGSSDSYWQRHQEGIPVSALYLADDRGCRWIGSARQWIGLPGWPVEPFQFCGAIAPARFPRPASRDVERIGTLFAERSPLRGLFGIDFVLQRERVFVVEINPRPTATLELQEWLLGESLLRRHTDVFRGIPLPLSEPGFPETSRAAAKVILYAPQAGRTPAAEFWGESLRPSANFPEIADVPQPNQPYVRGEPICTILADGPTAEDAIESLARRTARITREWGWPTDFAEAVRGLGSLT